MINKQATPPAAEILASAVSKIPIRNRLIIWLAGITFVLIVFLVLLPLDIRTFFWHTLQSQSILVSMLLIFCLVAISFVWSAGQKIDIWVFLTFNLRGARPLWLDWVMLGFTQLGNGFTTLALALIFFLANEQILAYDLILGTLTLWFVVVLIKALAHRSRPFIRLTQARIVGYRASGLSFPSGHTSQSFFIATLLIQHFHFNIAAAFLAYAIALMVGITRMYVGAHYPRDVMAGAILGSAWGMLGVIVKEYVLNGTW